VCLRSGILCQGCKIKLKEGKISELDIKVSKLLFDLAQKHRGLEKINFKHAVDASDLIVLIVGRGEIRFVVGWKGRITQELERHLKTRVRVIEEGATTLKLAQDILTPAEVLGINILYTKNSREYRVRVPRSHLKRVPGKVEDLKDLLERLTNKKTTVVFD
jgi:transcription antitermination factor NusA-like protein